MPRWNLTTVTPKRSNEPLSIDDYRISASWRLAGPGQYAGVLRVVRIPDRRVLFPFEGASDLGPFDSAEFAVASARELGASLIGADLLRPE